MKNILKADVKDVLLSDLGELVSYKRNEVEYEILALILEGDLDSQEELSVESKATIYVSAKELEEKGLEMPYPHDVIADRWKVETRNKVGELWELTCYDAIRPRP